MTSDPDQTLNTCELDSTWQDALRVELGDHPLDSVLQFVAEQRESHTVFPPENDVFRAFHCCPFSETNVVILGQDPYHGAGQAHGLAFSVQSGQKLPPSLRNIFKELREDFSCNNEHGDLTSWARQGILLLNTVLTVESGKANSHRKQGWEIFTDQVIGKLGQLDRPLVFVLWGNPAIKKSKLIGSQHVIIQSPHPSPLSAHRGFFGSRPFSQINRALAQFGRTPIDWSIPLAAGP